MACTVQGSGRGRRVEEELCQELAGALSRKQRKLLRAFASHWRTPCTRTPRRAPHLHRHTLLHHAVPYCPSWARCVHTAGKTLYHQKATAHFSVILALPRHLLYRDTSFLTGVWNQTHISPSCACGHLSHLSTHLGLAHSPQWCWRGAMMTARVRAAVGWGAQARVGFGLRRGGLSQPPAS